MDDPKSLPSPHVHPKHPTLCRVCTPTEIGGNPSVSGQGRAAGLSRACFLHHLHPSCSLLGRNLSPSKKPPHGTLATGVCAHQCRGVRHPECALGLHGLVTRTWVSSCRFDFSHLPSGCERCCSLWICNLWRKALCDAEAFPN